ncbi:MAG TPA: hypothetical protein VK861_04800, partial [Bacteroidales bacterium]|nr:hypothetical protein [Bacteroidales bacterium]
YFYEEGAIAWSVKKDPQVLRAIEVLNNPTVYNSILQGKSSPFLFSLEQNMSGNDFSADLNSADQELI